MSIRVNDFQWEPGKNDAEYIKLLESLRDDWQKIAQKAIAKLKALSKAQEPLTDVSISSAIECLLHPQDADDSDMVKAIDTAVRAMRLLKEQEPIEPKIIDTSNSKLYHSDMFKNYYCGNCGEFLHVINRRDMFCSQCGRKVKWE